MAEQETIADIIAERRAFEFITSGMRGFKKINKEYKDYTDRLEAAHRREHEALEFIAHYNDDEEQMDDPYCADGHKLADKAKEALGITEQEGGANG